jgi:hypothetical protein
MNARVSKATASLTLVSGSRLMTSSTASPLLDRLPLENSAKEIVLTQFEGVYQAELPLGVKS